MGTPTTDPERPQIVDPRCPDCRAFVRVIRVMVNRLTEETVVYAVCWRHGPVKARFDLWP